MLRADGTVRQLNTDQEKAQQLKAMESAKRLADMMAELGLGGDIQMTDDKTLVAALQRQWYTTTLEITSDVFGPFLQATLMVAAADGLASDESKWLKARTLLLGLSEAQTNQLLQFDCSSVSMAEVLAKCKAVKPTGSRADSTVNYLSRLIFYDGLTMAAQDGLSLDERVRASMAAEQLGLTEDEQDDVKDIVDAEEKLLQRKEVVFRASAEEDAAAAAAAAGGEDDGAANKRAAMQVLAYGAPIILDAELEAKCALPSRYSPLASPLAAHARPCLCLVSTSTHLI